ncbi:MAG: hypothetical protein EA389_09300 [Ilumatobacter sp.]|nr:MAG: hypothetical protein EA389_09300 [Ilumatobacter sp.]
MPDRTSTTSVTAPLTTIHGLADRIAAYRALDLLLFEVIGSWITDATAVPVRPYYAAWSQHHGWHADLWAGRYPVIPDRDVHTATAGATARFAPVRTALDAAPTDTERIRILAEDLLPQLATILAEHRAEVVAELDAPTARVLDLVVDDVRRDAAMAAQLLAPSAGDGRRPARIELDPLIS